MQSVAVTQNDPCSVIVTCQLAQGSTADGCQVQLKENGNEEVIESKTIPRSSVDEMIISQSMQFSFSPSDTYVAEAVGLEDETPIDTLRINATFNVTDDFDCIGEKRLYTLIIGFIAWIGTNYIFVLSEMLPFAATTTPSILPSGATDTIPIKVEVAIGISSVAMGMVVVVAVVIFSIWAAMKKVLCCRKNSTMIEKMAAGEKGDGDHNTYKENHISDPATLIDREGSTSPVRDSRLDWLSTTSLTEVDNSSDSKHLFVDTLKNKFQETPEPKQPRHSWATFSREAADTSHIQVSINPAAYDQNSDIDGFLYENMMMKKPNDSVKGDHLYDNLPPLTQSRHSQEKQLDEKNREVLGRKSLLYPTSSSFSRGEGFYMSLLSAPLQGMSNSLSLQNLTKLDQAQGQSFQTLPMSLSLHDLLLPRSPAPPRNPALPRNPAPPTSTEDVDDDADDIPTIVNDAYQSFLPQKSNRAGHLSFPPTSKMSDESWNKPKSVVKEPELQFSLGKGRYDPTTVNPQPVYDRLGPSTVVEDFGLPGGHCEKKPDVSDITTTANIAYVEGDSWSIYPSHRYNLEKMTSPGQTNSLTHSQFSGTIGYHQPHKPLLDPRSSSLL